MITIEQLRRLASECRADQEKVMVSPDVFEVLLDLAEGAVGEGGVVTMAQRTEGSPTRRR